MLFCPEQSLRLYAGDISWITFGFTDEVFFERQPETKSLRAPLLLAMDIKYRMSYLSLDAPQELYFLWKCVSARNKTIHGQTWGLGRLQQYLSQCFFLLTAKELHCGNSRVCTTGAILWMWEPLSISREECPSYLHTWWPHAVHSGFSQEIEVRDFRQILLCIKNCYRLVINVAIHGIGPVHYCRRQNYWKRWGLDRSHYTSRELSLMALRHFQKTGNLHYLVDDCFHVENVERKAFSKHPSTVSTVQKFQNAKKYVQQYQCNRNQIV